MSRRQPSPAGFSLVELLVALTVLGLLFAAGLPAVSGYLRASRVAGAMNTLIADLHQTRSLASMRRQTYGIAFDSGLYRIVETATGTAVRSRTLPRGVACSAPDTATFFAWGLTSPLSITLAEGGVTRTVQLNANGSVTHD